MDPITHIVDQTLNPRAFNRFLRRKPKPVKPRFFQLSQDIRLQILQSDQCVEVICERFNITASTYYRVKEEPIRQARIAAERKALEDRDAAIRAFQGSLSECSARFGISVSRASMIRNHY